VAAVSGILKEPHSELMAIDQLETLALHGALPQAILHIVDDIGLASDLQKITRSLASSAAPPAAGAPAVEDGSTVAPGVATAAAAISRLNQENGQRGNCVKKADSDRTLSSPSNN